MTQENADCLLLTPSDYKTLEGAVSKLFHSIPTVLKGILVAPTGSSGVNRELHSAMAALLRVRHPISPSVIRQWIVRLEGMRRTAPASSDEQTRAVMMLLTLIVEQLRACHTLLDGHYKATGDSAEHRFMRLYDATYGMRMAFLAMGAQQGVIELEEARNRAKHGHNLRFGQGDVS